MDTPELPENLNSAGRAYYDALRKLGFDPEGLLWAYDYEAEKFRLWLVWSGLDRFGPLAMSRLLFRAYRAAALPTEIDPFTVYVVPPEHVIAQMSEHIIKSHEEKSQIVETQLQMGSDEIDSKPLNLLSTDWIYHIQRKRFNVKKVNRDWRQFNENIGALAA